MITCIALFCLCVPVSAAERSGFIILSQQKKTQEPMMMKQQAPSTPQTERFSAKSELPHEADVSIYAYEHEIERLKRLLQDTKRELKQTRHTIEKLTERNESLIVELNYRKQEQQNQYEVRKGDSLWKIAKRSDVYNDPRKWIKLYNANIDRIKNPDLIYPGQLFRVPE